MKPSRGGDKMKKITTYIMLSLFTIAVLSIPINGVFATKPVFISATGAPPEIIPTVVKTAGGNTFFTAVGKGSYIGDMEGTTEATHRWHLKKDGSMNMHIEIVFTGSVLGKHGSINILSIGKMGEPLKWRIISGTGDLANLRGTGTLGPGYFEGYVHFDP